MNVPVHLEIPSIQPLRFLDATRRQESAQTDRTSRGADADSPRIQLRSNSGRETARTYAESFHAVGDHLVPAICFTVAHDATLHVLCISPAMRVQAACYPHAFRPSRACLWPEIKHTTPLASASSFSPKPQPVPCSFSKSERLFINTHQHHSHSHTAFAILLSPRALHSSTTAQRQRCQQCHSSLR